MSAPLVDRVRNRLVADRVDATAPAVARALRAEGIVLGDSAVLDLVGELRRDLVGAGVLQPLLDDPAVTDVLVNRADDVWVDAGRGLVRTDIRFRDDDDVRRLAQRLAAVVGRRLDDATPFVDARLADGTRLHAVIPPIAADGTTISLRVPRQRAFTLDHLVELGSIDSLGLRWLQAIVDARLAFLISGGTGSGKTTVLSALLGCAAVEERLVLIEDSLELRPDHPHVVRLQARTANVEGAGAVTLRDLVRQSLRMRPDRVVVGEVRGAEVVDLLAALNTGHEGGCGTVHANSARDVPARLEALGLTAGLDRAALHALVHAGIDVVIHLTRDRSGHRRVEGLHVLERAANGLVTTRCAFAGTAGGFTAGPAAGVLADRVRSAGVTPPLDESR